MSWRCEARALCRRVGSRPDPIPLQLEHSLRLSPAHAEPSGGESPNADFAVVEAGGSAYAAPVSGDERAGNGDGTVVLHIWMKIHQL